MRLLTVVGARPQFIKAAPVSAAIARVAGCGSAIAETIVHTGQHYAEEMSAALFDELRLPQPHHHLGVGSGFHGAQTAAMLAGLERVMMDERPDLVLLYGDTNSTLAGALAAAKLAIPIAHVEAGLRSGRRDMPEEVNRVIADRLASMLLCPSEHAVANLAAEGIDEGVTLVGDVMLDVLTEHLPKVRGTSSVLVRLGLRERGYAFATIHRAENTDDPGRLAALLDGLGRVAATMPVIFAVHPRTEQALRALRVPPGIRELPPQPYGAALAVAANARVVLTDSGGLQKEAYWLGVPCVTLREETEWPETLADGWNALAGADAAQIAATAARSYPSGRRPAVYGLPGASLRVVEALLKWSEPRTPQEAA